MLIVNASLDFMYITAQTGVLSVTGAVLGGGFGMQTWLPYLCLIPETANADYWSQLGVVLYAIPVAIASGFTSRLLARRLWKCELVLHVVSLFFRSASLRRYINKMCVSIVVRIDPLISEGWDHSGTTNGSLSCLVRLYAVDEADRGQC